MPSASRPRPIVVTGCPRSGTTWVGEIIGTSPKVFYLYEPFNGDVPRNVGLAERYIALTDENAAPHRADLDALVRLGRLSYRVPCALRGALQVSNPRPERAARFAAGGLKRRPLQFFGATRVCIKEPLAFYAAEWLERTYDAQIVVLVRHPLGVISSYLSLGWSSELAVIAQRPLPQRGAYLAAQISKRLDGAPSVLDDLILQWKIFTEATLDLKARHPDWTLIVHDRLCLSPERHFRTLFDGLGLDFGQRTERRIRADTSAVNAVDPGRPSQHLHQRDSRKLVDAWRARLEPDVIDYAMRATGSLWQEVMQSTRDADG